MVTYFNPKRKNIISVSYIFFNFAFYFQKIRSPYPVNTKSGLFMRYVKGAMKGQGRIGDTIFKKITGQPGTIGSIIGGPTKDQVDNLPEFQMTRENNAEFGGVIKLVALIRASLVTFLAIASRKQIWMRYMTKIVKRIQLLDSTSIRGQRNIILATAGASDKSLVNFEFNERDTFKSRFLKAIDFVIGVGRNSAAISTADAIVASDVVAPKGATHFKLIFSLLCLANREYDSDTKSWLPAPTDITDLVCASSESAIIEISAGSAALSIAVAFNGSPLMTNTEAVYGLVGIEFYQLIGANYYLMAQGNAGMILASA